MARHHTALNPANRAMTSIFGKHPPLLRHLHIVVIGDFTLPLAKIEWERTGFEPVRDCFYVPKESTGRSVRVGHILRGPTVFPLPVRLPMASTPRI